MDRPPPHPGQWKAWDLLLLLFLLFLLIAVLICCAGCFGEPVKLQAKLSSKFAEVEPSPIPASSRTPSLFPPPPFPKSATSASSVGPRFPSSPARASSWWGRRVALPRPVSKGMGLDMLSGCIIFLERGGQVSKNIQVFFFLRGGGCCWVVPGTRCLFPDKQML